jgi:hypothetical protein
MATHSNTEVGHGATITFSSGFFANVEDIEWSGITRDSIETTHMETSGGQTYLPTDNYDPGNLSVTWQYDVAETSTPYTSTAETVTLTFPDANTSTTSTWSASGFLTDYSVTLPDKDKVMATATVKFSGSITTATG